MVRQVIAETGAVKTKTRRALDSTVLEDAVAGQVTITQLIAQIRRVGREVPGAKVLIASVCTRLVQVTGHGYETAGKPRIAWDDQGARDELVSALVGDALALLEALNVEAITAAGGRPAESVALLALVAGQDVEPAEDSDASVGADLVTKDPTTEHLKQVEVLGDSAYVTGVAGKQWLPLDKPWPNRPAVEGGFLLDDFTFDAVANTLTCPADVTRTVSSQGRAKFGAICRQCPLRGRCITSKSGRTVLLGEHHVLQRQHRGRAQSEDFQATHRQHRPMVERSIGLAHPRRPTGALSRRGQEQ